MKFCAPQFDAPAITVASTLTYRTLRYSTWARIMEQLHPDAVERFP